MPAYEDVSEERQLPTRPPKVPVNNKTDEVAITTTIPTPLRRKLTLALAVHEVKLKDAVAQALEAWVEKHPPRL